MQEWVFANGPACFQAILIESFSFHFSALVHYMGVTNYTLIRKIPYPFHTPFSSIPSRPTFSMVAYRERPRIVGQWKSRRLDVVSNFYSAQTILFIAFSLAATAKARIEKRNTVERHGRLAWMKFFIFRSPGT